MNSRMNFTDDKAANALNQPAAASAKPSVATTGRNFAITGVGGYIAPRHLKAIRDTDNRIVAALDPNDSVGVLDQFSYDINFFTEFERFDRHIEKLRRGPTANRIDYVTVCSPNHLHDAHVRFALRAGADAICEKPLVLNPWNCDALQELETEYGRRVFSVLQLRLHPALLALKESLAAPARPRWTSAMNASDAKNPLSTHDEHRRSESGFNHFSRSEFPRSEFPHSDRALSEHRFTPQPQAKHRVSLTYITSRGPWYLNSWKGNVERSGGLATNIGIHFFDMLLWLFGGLEDSEVYHNSPTRVGGHIELERATVDWYLSVDRHDLPEQVRAAGKPTFRSIVIDGNELEFSENFTDLHTRVYQGILAGQGFGIADARPSIELAHAIRHMPAVGVPASAHPFLRSNVDRVIGPTRVSVSIGRGTQMSLAKKAA